MGDDYADRVAAAKKIHERARYLRGRFLNTVAVIERDIAIVLTEYFCQNDEEKREVFFTKVAEKISLQKKKEILIEIVENDYPKYWEENKEHFKKLKDIQEFRNKLAHSIVDVSEEALLRPIDEGVGFIQWKQGIPITDKEFEAFEDMASDVHSTISDIRMLLPFKEKRTHE